MSIHDPLSPISRYSYACIKSVYDEEAMTALELSGRTAAKVNECCKAVNECVNHVNEMIDILNEQNQIILSLSEEVEALKTSTAE